MTQPINERRLTKQGKGTDVAQQRAVKKSYKTPILIEYGGIAKLTQTAAGSGTDFARMRPCL